MIERGQVWWANLDRSPWYISLTQTMSMTFDIEIDQENDGRWIAEVPALSGVLSYGQSRNEAIARRTALALRVIAERLEHAEAPAELLAVTFRAA